MYDVETLAKIAELRDKSINGSITNDELRFGIRLLREGRVSAAHASEGARRKKAKAEVKSADELLDELGI